MTRRRSQGPVGTPTSAITYVGPPHAQKGLKEPCLFCGGRVIRQVVGKGRKAHNELRCQRCGDRRLEEN